MDSHPKVGIAGSQLLWPDGVPQRTPFRFQGILSELDRGLRLGFVSRLVSPWTRSRRRTVACPAEWVSGACIMLRRSMLDQIGLLDEGLYTYFDDIDICLRARRAGWETWYVPESRIIHLEGSSTGVTSQAKKRRPAYWFQARRRYFLKNYGGLTRRWWTRRSWSGSRCGGCGAGSSASRTRTRPTCWATRSATASSGRGSSSGTLRTLRCERRRREPWRRRSEMSLVLGQGDVELEGRSSRG